MTHDPIRAATLLREIFANERAHVAFFLGAGCPMSIQIEDPDTGRRPLIPDIRGLSNLVRSALQRDKATLNTKLTAYLVSQGVTDPDIEVMLSRIRSLMDVVGNGIVHNLNLPELDEIEKEICRLITNAVKVELPEGRNGYRDIAGWIQGFERTRAVEVFTTNYDLLVESALEEARLTYFDGFTGARHPFFDVSAIDRDGLPPHWTKVWKLHGSINWRDSPDRGGKICRFTEADDSDNSLIHPSHRKYDQSRRMPYLALLDRAKAFLRNHSAVLILSGYSFRDEHLNELIANGLETNPTSVAIALLHGNIEQYKTAISLATAHANLILMANNKGVVGKRLDRWQADLEQDQTALRHAFDDPPADGWSGGNKECKLGDFAVLGNLLRDVSGSFAQVERVVRA